MLLDQYLELEPDDALEVLAWIAESCNGNLGMMGESWGRFKGLQVAARRPPTLKCVAFSTDDCNPRNDPGRHGIRALPPELWATTEYL